MECRWVRGQWFPQDPTWPRRGLDVLPAFLPFLLVNAEEMSFEDFAVTVAHFVTQADADGAH
ncbi:MAG: hypothetical protein WA964_09965, partial [Ilumatobacter sp.]|uniref:hypothetical protein n=1 Tax=Ilumatobacter sp. TaxID=1967498 RepID=UPI003C7867D8